MMGCRLAAVGRTSNGRGERQIASRKSLVLPAPARLLPLLPTVNSVKVEHLRESFSTVLPGNGQRPGTFPPSLRWSPMSPAKQLRFLDLDGRASGLEILLELRGIVLRHGVLDGLRGAFDEILRFLQAQAGDGA